MVAQTFNESIEVFKKHPVPWILIGLVVMVVGGMIPILGGLILLPGVVREGRASIEGDRAPDVGALFNGIGNDIGPMFLYGLAQIVIGTVTCGLGAPVVWILLWYSVEAAADGRVEAPDALRVSLQWTKRNLADTIMMALACSFIATLGATLTCGLGIIVVTPFIFIMWTVHWMKIREDVYAIAEQNGITVAPA